MQRIKTNAYSRDVKEAISEIKKHEYRRKLFVALNPAALRDIDYRVRTDSQLTMRDKLRLLSEIEGTDISSGQKELPNRTRAPP